MDSRRLLPALEDRFSQAFPETNGDPYDFIFPPTSFVRPFTVIRYEADLSRPDERVRRRLRQAFKLNGELSRRFVSKR